MNNTIFELIQPNPVDFRLIQRMNGQNLETDEVAWQEIIFQSKQRSSDFFTQLPEDDLDFMGVDVLWGTQEKSEILFGSDFETNLALQLGSEDGDSHTGNHHQRRLCPWDVVVPFCQTVLQVCQVPIALPFVRIGMQRFLLKHFDYELKSWIKTSWAHQVKALAVPDTNNHSHNNSQCTSNGERS